jgi:hypothetical protein
MPEILSDQVCSIDANGEAHGHDWIGGGEKAVCRDCGMVG